MLSYFNFKTNDLKNANLFQKTGVESIEIESATFPYKTALSEANVWKNRLGSTEWTYRKRVLPVTILFFRKLSFILRTLWKELVI